MNRRIILLETEIQKQEPNRNSGTEDSINEMKKALENIGKHADQMEEKISDQEDENLETIQEEKERELRILESEKT